MLRIVACALLLAGVAGPPKAGAASLENVVRRAARHQGVPEALALGLAQVESRFRPGAVSSEGAQGLTQIMPATARAIGCHGSLFDPAVNAECGLRYLRMMIGRTRGNVRRALAFYNVGETLCRRRSHCGFFYSGRVLDAARRFRNL